MPDELSYHPMYLEFLNRWIRIADCIEGEERIKEAGELYLDYPLPLDDSSRADPAYAKAYKLFLAGAHFVEFTAEAVEDLVSAAFRQPLRVLDVNKKPIDMPEELAYLQLTTTGRDLVAGVGAFGRQFLLVDYPEVGPDVSIADDVSNKAYFSIYNPLDVVDWEESYRSGESELIRVVLREVVYIQNTDTSEKEKHFKYRDFRVENSTVVVDVYTPDPHSAGTEEYTITSTILKANGVPLKEIPGTFIGTTSNTPQIDKSPVIGIANSNIKHYQTWAELMHTQTMVGHPHLTISGLPPGWNEQAEKSDYKLKLAAGEVLTLEGEHTQARLLEINTNNLIHFRTIELLEQSMFEQGARIKAVSRKAGVESAEALKLRSSASMSKLASIVSGVEQAIDEALKWVAMYMGTEETYSVSINKDFFTPDPDGSLLSSLHSSEAGGTAPHGTVISYLKQIELVEEGEQTEALLKQTGVISVPSPGSSSNNNNNNNNNNNQGE